MSDIRGDSQRCLHSLESGRATAGDLGTVVWSGSRGRFLVGGGWRTVCHKQKHVYNCDVKLWTNFVTIICLFSVLYFYSILSDTFYTKSTANLLT